MADFFRAVFACFLFIFSFGARAQTPRVVPTNRIASVYISQDFLNEQLAAHDKSQLFRDLALELDPEHNQVILHGKIQVPVEELQAVNLDPKLGSFRFQVSIHPQTTKHGHLILEFPLDQTFFYPASSKHPQRDRVIVPVQMLSLALASARGYLSALSGDFSTFERETEKYKALLKGLDHLIAREKNRDALEELRTRREEIRLKLAAVPVERKQLAEVGKQLSHVLGFTGKKELDLNEDLGARKNALILKIKLDELVPYLKGVDLGDVRILRDKKDGGGENYLAVDIDSLLSTQLPPTMTVEASPRKAMKVPPSLIVRLNQSLLESSAIVAAEKEATSSKLRDFAVGLKDDGLHVSGRWRTFFFFSVPFDTQVDFVSTGPDVFEMRVRELQVAGMDFKFLTRFVLDSLERRLDSALKGRCSFEYVKNANGDTRGMRVTVDPKKLVPAFPELHVVGVDVRDREFLLKIGKL